MYCRNWISNSTFTLKEHWKNHYKKNNIYTPIKPTSEFGHGNRHFNRSNTQSSSWHLDTKVSLGTFHWGCAFILRSASGDTQQTLNETSLWWRTLLVTELHWAAFKTFNAAHFGILQWLFDRPAQCKATTISSACTKWRNGMHTRLVGIASACKCHKCRNSFMSFHRARTPCKDFMLDNWPAPDVEAEQQTKACVEL